MPGVLATLLGAPEERAHVVGSAPPRDPVLAAWFGGEDNDAGVDVTANSAMRVTAVYACSRVLAETVAALPRFVYRRTADGRERDLEHPLHRVLHDRANRRQTAFEWVETMIGHQSLRGVAYSEIILDPVTGRIAELLPLHPDRIIPFEAPDGRVAYRYTPQAGGQRILLDQEVLRLPGMSHDGIEALSPIGLHRTTIGLALASKKYLARFYRNSAAPKGGIKVPGNLNDQAVKTLREDWERRHRGPENAHRLAVFDAGMEWVTIGLSHEDQQYLELQQFGVTDICRMFRVPPHKVADLSKATFSNIEHQAIEFVTDAIWPLVSRIEQRLNGWLLTPEERRTHYVGFELKGLLRGDSTARANLYQRLFQVGAISPSQIARLEDLPPVDNGDRHYVPLNMAPLDQASEILMRAAEGPQGLAALPGNDPEPSRPNGHDQQEGQDARS